MSNVEVRKARVGDVNALVHNMRRADLDELEAASSIAPAAVVVNGIHSSAESWVVHVDGALMAMWGVVELGHCAARCDRRGWGWLLTTDVVTFNKKLFWKLSKLVLTDLLARWGSLENFIDLRHTQAFRWGEQLGFAFDPPVPFGDSKLPARRFVITKEALNV